MKIPTYRYRSPLGRIQLEPRADPEDIKREGWLDQRLLVVSPEDTRLDWTEREMVKRIGNRLYGGSGVRHD